jgi:hypothetical protein
LFIELQLPLLVSQHLFIILYQLLDVVVIRMGPPLALFTETLQENEQNKIMRPNYSAANHVRSEGVNEEIISITKADV